MYGIRLFIFEKCFFFSKIRKETAAVKRRERKSEGRRGKQIKRKDTFSNFVSKKIDKMIV
jgi:hypothetical protein